MGNGMKRQRPQRNKIVAPATLQPAENFGPFGQPMGPVYPQWQQQQPTQLVVENRNQFPTQQMIPQQFPPQQMMPQQFQQQQFPSQYPNQQIPSQLIIERQNSNIIQPQLQPIMNQQMPPQQIFVENQYPNMALQMQSPINPPFQQIPAQIFIERQNQMQPQVNQAPMIIPQMVPNPILQPQIMNQPILVPIIPTVRSKPQIDYKSQETVATSWVPVQSPTRPMTRIPNNSFDSKLTYEPSMQQQLPIGTVSFPMQQPRFKVVNAPL